MTHRILAVIVCCAAVTIMAHAQSYTEHLQKQQNGNGTVTVNQSKELEALINGSGASSSKTSTSKPSASNHSNTTSSTPKSTTTDSNKPTTTTDVPEHREEHRASTSSSRSKSNSDSENKNIVRRERTTESNSNEINTRVLDNRKKVMKGTRKVTGYRIQVYAGGNSRADREKAQQAGNRIKAHFPSYPIFVHFYSPSWKCRVGNFVEYKEAEQALRRIRGMGFRQAVIVKGKITVQ